MKRITFCVFFLLHLVLSWAGDVFQTYTASDIHTVLFFRNGWETSYPAIQLNTDEQLALHFDVLDSTLKDYKYQIIHCNSQWEPSDIMTNEYLDGFEENPIRDYQYSVNTTVSYVHYSVLLPNSDIKFKVSGNYIIKIYDEDADKPVLIRRFCVYEKMINIEADCKRAQDPKYMFTHQQLNVKLTYTADIPFPERDIKLKIRQNGNEYTEVYNPRPSIAEKGSVDYSFMDGIQFEGGNEFRNLDLKSIRYASIDVASIEYRAPHYFYELVPADIQSRKRYSYQQDLNGFYYVRNDRGTSRYIDADYVWIHFLLPVDEMNGDVYVFGGLSDWQLTNTNKMIYNAAKHGYEATLQLKQGYYNYQYVFVPKGKSFSSADSKPFESSFYETENDYYIMVYVQFRGERFERLAGYLVANSLKKQ
jgi:hypothetical protein